ncbi:matrixin family metalloprotease [Nitrososphaeria virus YSH_922147]|uniref:Matrixin family metalloprotease n=1 Tax=Nitrososphaeria virus YSH_922147 TaxID=3071323 RepID=A0A976UBG9_9CAUD|nr:matrixin family metalloprotease [Yangshan Harbor Nitrososphaeria virus]UVF62420.1 matrixin family metalloprotease [Nitrososphaeria virus YSH_922147]
MTCNTCVHTNDKHYTIRDIQFQKTINENTIPNKNALNGATWASDIIYWRRDSSYKWIDDKTMDKMIASAFLEASMQTRLKIRKTNHGDAQIIINFLGKRDEPYFTSQSILAFAFGPGQGMGGNITMNSDNLWLLRKEPLKALEAKRLGYIDNFQFPDNEIRFYDPLHTLKHEGGHALGLNHITDLNMARKSVMYPYYNGLRTFGEADLAYLQRLYGNAGVSKTITDVIRKRINNF